jgi:hypothetical protein
MKIKNQEKNLSIPGKFEIRKRHQGQEKIHQRQGNLTTAQRKRSKYSSKYKKYRYHTVRKIHSRELLDLRKLPWEDYHTVVRKLKTTDLRKWRW